MYIQTNILLLLILVLINSNGIFSTETTVSNVLELDNSFRPRRFKGKWLVLFYVPWSEQSQLLFPLWEEVAIKYKTSGLLVGKMNIYEHEKAGEAIKIKGTPSIIFFNDGVAYEYTGNNEEKSILHFVKKVDGPLLFNITDKDEYLMVEGRYAVFFLLVYNDTIDPTLQETYAKSAKPLKQISKFFYTQDISMLPETELPQNFPCILVIKSGFIYLYDGNFHKNLIQKWMYSERLDHMMTINLNEMYQLVGTTVNKRFAVLTTSDEHNSHGKDDALYKIIREIAKSRIFHTHFQFIHTEGYDILSKMTGNYLTMPSFILWNLTSFYYYDLRTYLTDNNVAIENTNESVIIKFITSSLKGDLTPIYGYSKWYSMTAILTDINASMNKILFAYPIISRCVLFGLVLYVAVSLLRIGLEKFKAEHKFKSKRKLRTTERKIKVE